MGKVYSVLNWKTVTRDYVTAILEDLINSRGISNHRVLILPKTEFWKGYPTLQINAYSDLCYEKQVDGTSDGKIVAEEPASLVYSIHQNGSLVVLVYPHKSEMSELSLSVKFFIIDYFRTSDDLSGITGASRTKKHFEIFSQLCYYSRCDFPPTKTYLKFLNRLDKINEKYISIYGTVKEVKKVQFELNMALAVGIVGGVLTSTIFPLMRDVGSNELVRANLIIKQCTGNTVNNSELCLAANDYSIHKLLSNVLDPLSILFVAILFMLFVLLKITQMLKSHKA